MTKAVLEEFGITKEDVLERVVGKIVDELISEEYYDGDDESTSTKATKFQEACRKAVLAKADEAVKNIAAKNVLPNVETYLENLVLKSTNRWGEQTGEPQTFIEYLTKRCEDYMAEPVDYDGKPKTRDSYSFTAKATRISYMMEKHLHYHISTAVANALKDLNSKIAQGISETVKIQLAQTLEKLKVGVSV